MNATTADDTVRFEHGGTAWDIPRDLIDLQRRWDDAHASVETLVEGDDVEALNAARRRRLDLTDQLVGHPWLLEALAAGRRYQADLALKDCARERH